MQENIGLTRLKNWGLIVVDMQNDFLATGGYYDQRDKLDKQVVQGELSLEAKNKIMSRSGMARPDSFRLRATALAPVVTRIEKLISHSRKNNRPIAYLKAVYGREFRVLPPFLRLEPHRQHYPCRPKSWGAELIESIHKSIEAKPVESRERIIEKHTYDGFFATRLLQFLRNNRVDTVIIVGVETQVCVFATAKSAAMHQFNTVIPEDCVWTAQEDLGAGALSIFRGAYGSTAALREILDANSHA